MSIPWGTSGGRNSPAAGHDGAVGTNDDSELLAVAGDFRATDCCLNRVCALDTGMDEPVTAELHRKWEEYCSRAANLSASTEEGLRAKASMLLAVLEVLAPEPRQREPHERLAESLAEDLLR